MEQYFLYRSNPDVLSLKKHTYSVQHNTDYMCAARFGLYLGHPQECQYKNLIREKYN
jgi:hypothetical protein